MLLKEKIWKLLDRYHPQYIDSKIVVNKFHAPWRRRERYSKRLRIGTSQDLAHARYAELRASIPDGAAGRRAHARWRPSEPARTSSKRGSTRSASSPALPCPKSSGSVCAELSGH